MKLANLRKRPPNYLCELEVDGRTVRMTTRDLIRFRRFRCRVLEQLDVIVPMMPQWLWELELRLAFTLEDFNPPLEVVHDGEL